MSEVIPIMNFWERLSLWVNTRQKGTRFGAGNIKKIEVQQYIHIA